MIVFYLLALVIGLIMPLQAPINGRLSQMLGHPVWGAAFSFFVGSFTLLLIGLLSFRNEWSLADFKDFRWWHLTGGLIGASLVFSMIILAPKIGILKMMVILILGQLVSSTVIDHFGFMAVPLYEFNFRRLIGILLVLSGVLVLLRGKTH